MNSPEILKDEIESIIKERIDNFELNPDERFYRPVIADTGMDIKPARDDHRPELFYQGQNIEFDTFASDMIEYGQAVRQVERTERGIVITTPKNGCFNAIKAAIFAQAIMPIQPIQVISHDEYKKQYTQDLDLQLEYDVDFDWNYQKNNAKPYKIKKEVDNQKIQQALAKRARKLRQKELYNESIKKHSRIWKNKSR